MNLTAPAKTCPSACTAPSRPSGRTSGLSWLILVIVPALGWAARRPHHRASRPLSATCPAPPRPPERPRSSASPTAETPRPLNPRLPPAPPHRRLPLEPDHGAVIQVLNGTGTQGYAGQQAPDPEPGRLRGTSAANADGWATQTSTVSCRGSPHGGNREGRCRQAGYFQRSPGERPRRPRHHHRDPAMSL